MSSFVPTGKIILIKDVDIDASYTHQYYFATAAAQYNFFYGKKFLELTDSTYQRKNINSIIVPYLADDIAGCKYLMWQNPTYSTKWYYAFITKIDYENPKTSIVSYILDVYQTYLFDIVWKESFVEREHTTRYVNGAPVVNLLDEGLEYGSTYDVVAEETLVQTGDTDNNLYYLVLGTTLSNLSQRYNGVPTRLAYFIVPLDRSSYRQMYYSDGTNSTLLSDADVVLNAFQNDSSLVNKLISACIVPYLSLNNFVINDTSLSSYTFSGSSIALNSVSGASNTLKMLQISNNNHWFYMTNNFGDKYDDFPSYTESKLLMYPYSFTEITNDAGDSMIIKNEFIEDDDLVVGALNIPSNNNKTIYMVNDYIRTGYHKEFALVDTNETSFPILDDYAASYLQANSNANRVAISNAKSDLYVAQQQAEAARTTEGSNIKRQFLSDKTSSTLTTSLGVTGLIAIGTVASGGTLPIIGALAASGGTAIAGISGIESAKKTVDNSLASANTTYDNAMLAAKTTYQNTQASVLAKVQDAEQVPPNLRTIGTNYLFNICGSLGKLRIRKKTIKQQYRTALTDYFKQYGYKVNKLETPNFHTRTRYNYIKMAEPNVYGEIPNDDLDKIRTIFTKGITLWHGDYVGDYTTSNPEI